MSERQTILIVDDVPANIDVLSGILRHDYRVKAALDGEKALRIVFSETPPDLILLDIMMPGMSGLEVCRALKADPRARSIPVIFVTALGEVEDESRGFEAGGVDYITKPVSPPIVHARVRAQLALANQARHLEGLVRERTEELEDTRLQVIRRLGRAAEFRDNETGLHVIRMSHYARLLGQAVGMSDEEVELLFTAAPMHDVGKIGIPDRVLLKPGPLDDEERRIMETHCQIGAEIIGEHDSPLLRWARVIALTHHEKWDGSGYPNGLAGEDIPLTGRICAVADVFDALTSSRPYKKAWSVADTMALIRREAGRHFDPELVECFEPLLPQVLAVRERHLDNQPPQ